MALTALADVLHREPLASDSVLMSMLSSASLTQGLSQIIGTAHLSQRRRDLPVASRVADHLQGLDGRDCR